MKDATVTFSSNHLANLENLYALKGKTEILQFINQYPFLLSVLLEAPEKIHQYFPNSQLNLEINLDPEIIDYRPLVLSIVMELEPQQAIKKQNQMDTEWWLDYSYEIRKNMCILLVYSDEF